MKKNIQNKPVLYNIYITYCSNPPQSRYHFLLPENDHTVSEILYISIHTMQTSKENTPIKISNQPSDKVTNHLPSWHSAS